MSRSHSRGNCDSSDNAGPGSQEGTPPRIGNDTAVVVDVDELIAASTAEKQSLGENNSKRFAQPEKHEGMSMKASQVGMERRLKLGENKANRLSHEDGDTERERSHRALSGTMQGERVGANMNASPPVLQRRLMLGRNKAKQLSQQENDTRGPRSYQSFKFAGMSMKASQVGMQQRLQLGENKAKRLSHEAGDTERGRSHRALCSTMQGERVGTNTNASPAVLQRRLMLGRNKAKQLSQQENDTQIPRSYPNVVSSLRAPTGSGMVLGHPEANMNIFSSEEGLARARADPEGSFWMDAENEASETLGVDADCTGDEFQWGYDMEASLFFSSSNENEPSSLVGEGFRRSPVDDMAVATPVIENFSSINLPQAQPNNEVIAEESSVEDMAVASPVTEDLNPNVLPQAQHYDEAIAEEKRRKEREYHNRQIFSFFLIGIGCLLLGFLFGYVVRGSVEEVKNDQKLSLPAPSSSSPAPSASPSQAPTSLAELVFELLPTTTVKAILESNTSAQALAYSWLVQDELLTTYPIWQIVQRFALATVYYATGGPNWYNNTNWLSSSHECEWGLLINSAALSNGFIAVQNLRGDELEGYVYPPPTEGPCPDISMRQFQHLWLVDNGLDGTVPAELWLLTSLKSIALQENPALKGSISTNIEKVTTLEALGFFFSDFLGTTIPTEIGKCKNLSIITLSGSNFGGPIPSEIGRLEKLQYLWFDDNNIVGSLPSELGSLRNLVSMNGLRAGSLTGTIPSEFGLLESLIEIDFEPFEPGKSALIGTIPSEFGLLTSLQVLNFNFNALSGTIPSELGNIPGLAWLTLNENNLSGSLPSQLGRMSMMFELTVPGNILTGAIPSQVGNFGRGAGMWDLWLNGNNLTGPIPSEVGSIPFIENDSYLWLQDNNFSGPIPSELGLLSNRLLEFVLTSNEHLTGTIPSVVCGENNSVVVFNCSDTLCGCSCKCPIKGRVQPAF